MLLSLDPSIRNWVFIPITLITISVSLLMKYLTFIFNSGSANSKIIASTCERKEDNFLKNELENKDVDIKVKSAINRSTKLRTNFMYISERGFKTRKAFFCNETNGVFSQKIEAK